MSWYLITGIFFGLLLLATWFVFGKLKPTVYLNAGGQDVSTPPDIQASKDKVTKIRARRLVVGIGTVIGLCLLTWLLMAAASPARKIHGALWPSATPTVTSTRTVTPTRTATRTPRVTATPNQARTQTAIAKTASPTATKTLAPSGSGGSSVTIIQTYLVVITRIIYMPQTVVVTVTNTSMVTETPSPTVTATVSETLTPTITATVTETPTP